MTPKFLVIHHSVSRLDNTSILDIDRWHKGKGYPKSKRGYHVGYHFVIGKDWYTQTRDEDEKGAHALLHNHESLGICIVGNFQLPTSELNVYQKTKLAWLLRLLMKNHKFSSKEIVLHRDVGSTECPGKFIDRKFILSLLGEPLDDKDESEFLSPTKAVDSRYGAKRTWISFLREKRMALNPYVLAKIRRLPTTREISGLAYGYWDFKAIFENRVGNDWLYKTKPDYERG